MLFTAFFDESDTHDRRPTVIMAAFLGHARQWTIFDRRLGGLQRQYGFRIFHAKEFKARTGDFAGWSDRKGAGLIGDLSDLVGNTLTEGMCVHLEHERYMSEYRSSPIPKGMNLDSQYGICFRSCLTHISDIIDADGKHHRLDVVIEDGHKNVRDTVRIFDDLKRRMLPIGHDMLGTITIAKKSECLQLMVSDFLAHGHSLMRNPKGLSVEDYIRRAPEPEKGKAGLTFLEIRPDALRGLKQNFEDDKQARVAQWRASRDATVSV